MEKRGGFAVFCQVLHVKYHGRYGIYRPDFKEISDLCLGGGIGRRKGLKIPRSLAPYEFDSRPRHQK